MKWLHETRLVKDLKEYEANPRKITEKGLKDLKKSITNFGIVEPVVINTDGTIIGGHGRKQALMSLKIDTVPVYVPNKALSDKQVQELNVRLNKNIAGEWDFIKLNEWFEEDDLLEWGFENWEITNTEDFDTDILNQVDDKILEDLKSRVTSSIILELNPDQYDNVKPKYDSLKRGGYDINEMFIKMIEDAYGSSDTN